VALAERLISSSWEETALPARLLLLVPLLLVLL